MKPKFVLSFALALILSDGLLGCASAGHHPAISKELRPELFLHLIGSYEYPEPSRLIASVPVHLSMDFDFLTQDKQHFRGRVDSENGKYVLHFQIYLYNGTNFFDGPVELDKPDDPGTRPYNDKTPFVYQPMFILSRNSSASSFLKRQEIAVEKEWNRSNQLTPQQIAKVEQKFRLMHPGLTEKDVFALLGLSHYRHRLPDPRLFRSNDWDLDEFQLATGAILSLEVDYPDSYKTDVTEHADGPYGNHWNWPVIHATLGSEIWSEPPASSRRIFVAN
ncbi:MAG TPA: hypothetical protein VK742_13710 [Candidatus Sulfotelmatobacter sp.]|jgi:hypothetical protein|nr:hypothetical protein [Candidatus Sulfotelmatobacter sp.]